MMKVKEAYHALDLVSRKVLLKELKAIDKDRALEATNVLLDEMSIGECWLLLLGYNCYLNLSESELLDFLFDTHVALYTRFKFLNNDFEFYTSLSLEEIKLLIVKLIETTISDRKKADCEIMIRLLSAYQSSSNGKIYFGRNQDLRSLSYLCPQKEEK